MEKERINRTGRRKIQYPLRLAAADGWEAEPVRTNRVDAITGSGGLQLELMFTSSEKGRNANK